MKMPKGENKNNKRGKRKAKTPTKAGGSGKSH